MVTGSQSFVSVGDVGHDLIAGGLLQFLPWVIATRVPTRAVDEVSLPFPLRPESFSHRVLGLQIELLLGGVEIAAAPQLLAQAHWPRISP
jgi:hypothetical protein